MMLDQGNEVGKVARERFPDGKLIEEDYRHISEAVESTGKALHAGDEILFEAAFEFENIVVRADILKRLSDNTFELIEVKSSTGVSSEYLDDVALQKYVLEGAGINVSSVYLMHINNKCVYPELDNLFEMVDLTDHIKENMQKVKDELPLMKSMLSKGEVPEIDIGPHCSQPRTCDFKVHCWSHIPQHSVFELYRLKQKTKFDLYRKDRFDVRKLTCGEAKFSDRQLMQIKTVKSGTSDINLKGIRDLLGEIDYPIYYLDFETYAPAIPRFEGMRPFQQFPFQFSCHIEEKEGKIEHREYLHVENSDPSLELSRNLVQIISSYGTVVAYNASFEAGVLEVLSQRIPDFADELMGIRLRLWDLMKPFQKFYYHPDFHGSYSLKRVLPAIVPDMSYENLGVKEGAGAQYAYLRLISQSVGSEEKAKIASDLLEYCTQDTLAMVKLMEKLRKLTDA